MIFIISYSLSNVQIHAHILQEDIHGYIEDKQPCKVNLMENAFPHWITFDWNALPNDIVIAPSINVFENRLKTFWKVSPPSNLLYNVCPGVG